jgi:hypothetical protein
LIGTSGSERQSGINRYSPIGSITAPDNICAPTSDPFSTTTTEHSGLFKKQLPIYENKNGVQVRVVALGTGQALGDRQALLVNRQRLLGTTACHESLAKPVEQDKQPPLCPAVVRPGGDARPRARGRARVRPPRHALAPGDYSQHR